MKRLFLLLFCLAGPAFATSLDHRCLNTCISDKGDSTACLKQCTYDVTPLQKPTPTMLSPGPSPHAQFSPVVQDDGSLLLKHPQPVKPPSRMDYQCLALCEKDSEPVEMCRERCAYNPLQKVGAQSTISPLAAEREAVSAK